MKIFALLLAAVLSASAAPFEIKEGDRVLLLGDALLERENTYGLLETRMHEQFPNVKFTVRNLSWSGETPKGWSRASFDKPEKGWERLKEQIAEVKPTVAILGFGMAASLQEMTDRSGDQTLNPDPARYGAEPMSAARFKKELVELMDAINASTPDKQPARFVLLAPTKHEDLREKRPGMPDPAAHNALLTQYAASVEVLAKERSALFVRPRDKYVPKGEGAVYWTRTHTENGIHLNAGGYSMLATDLIGRYEVDSWEKRPNLRRDELAERMAKPWQPPSSPLRSAILKKNDLFFHQFRPANSTYLFGFRKHEQGKNAAEMHKFTPLIEAADAEVDRLKRQPAATTPPPNTPAATAQIPQPDLTPLLKIVPGPRYQIGALDSDNLDELKKALAKLGAEGAKTLRISADKSIPYKALEDALAAAKEAKIPDVAVSPGASSALPLPKFTVTDNLEITLWADTNLVGKPVGMNWDAAGRLWVACSPVYPQIAPGAHPEDKVVVIEDTDHDGKADKSTTFATDLLIAAGVAPDFGTSPPAKQSAKESPPKSTESTPSISAAYVGASTELVRVEDTDGDGKGDTRRIILSGFGTEDTHHTIHTLRWGPDGRLYFNQSIYIHSHMETPYGMVRLNSGGICAYDPRTERVEVFARGFINTWGHAWDKWGQSFATDGAGFEGVHWVIPGAMYRTYEGARRILPSISPGSYPKYSGLEIIQSPLFPDDWQGNAITCDFRAHKLTRFQINDLSQPAEPGKAPLSGYITKELPNPVVTSDASFRPIDAKLGPDGALYIGDWTNPIINHGEVDFRDPRRDHVNGRIWRIAPKAKAGLEWTAFHRTENNSNLFQRVISENAWESQQAAQMLHASLSQWKGLDAPDPNKSSREALLKEGIDEDETLRRAPGPHSFFTLALTSAEKFQLAANRFEKHALLMSSGLDEQLRDAKDYRVRAGYARILADWHDLTGALETLVKDPNPRVRVAAMRALVQKLSFHASDKTKPLALYQNRAVSLVLEAALNAPGGAAKQVRSEDKGTSQFNQPTFADTADPYYGYAAWLSINELDDVFLAALTEGKWKPDTADKQQQLAWALGALRPEKSGKALSNFIAKNGLPKDGSGPWIELIGQAGGPAELRMVLDGLLANTVPDGDEIPPLADKSLAYTNKEANRRAAAALVVAAKRGVKPANPPYGGWQFHMYAPNEAINDAIRLAGLWKQDVPFALVARITNNGPKERLDAIFESLRTLGTDNAANFLTAFLEPKLAKEIDNQFLNMVLEENQPAIRRRALGALSAFRPDVSLAFLRGVLDETDSAAQLPLWRELFSSDPFNKALLAKLPTLTKEQAVPALRAARELGKRGEKLVAAFTPLAGEAPVAPVPQDLTSFIDNTKKNGNPVEGELVYRRVALTCTVCHAIGGAGGKVGPDLGTIGASAPLDYIIESTVNPAAKVKEGFHAIAVTTKDGKTLSGTIAKETDTQIVLRDLTGAEQTVEKTNVKERTNIGSLMPAGLVNALNHRDQANLFAFMAQLGKPGPFDASKASIARAWRVYAGDQIESLVAGRPDPAKGVPVYSLVDGRVTKDLMEMPVAMAGNQSTLVAVARFSLVNAGQQRLHLAGITKAWLNGAPLAIASDPNPVITLPAGDHTLVVKLDTKTLPDHFRAEVPDARFLPE